MLFVLLIIIYLRSVNRLKKPISTNYIFSKGNTTSAIVVFSSAKSLILKNVFLSRSVII